MSDEVKTCKDCKHYIADGSSRHGHCELKKSRIDKWGQEVTVRRMASGKACKKAEPKASLYLLQSVRNAGGLRKLLCEFESYKQEYRLAAAANKQLADALDKAREENKMLRLQIFAFIRNAAILPVGRNLHKSEQEITDKTFETIEAAKAMLDVEAVKAAMNLATNKENRFDNAD